MKGKKIRHRQKSRLSKGLLYSGFTVLLTCLIVVGYYLVSNGIIFGNYTASEPYISQDYIDNPNLVLSASEAKPDLTVTPKNSYTSLKKTDPVSEDENGTKVTEYLGFQVAESEMGATQFSGKRTIYFDLENKLNIGDLYSAISIMAKNDGEKLTVYSAEFTKSRKEDAENRKVTLFSANESVITKDNSDCRTGVSWNTDNSVTFTTKNPSENGGMRFYIDGVRKEAVDLKGYRYLKLVVDSEAEVVLRGYKALPEVPKTNGSTQKGTAANPFVILEIVPDLSETTYSILVSSQEEGLPFDPLEFSYEVMKKKSTITFLDAGASNGGKSQLYGQSYAFNDKLIGESWKQGDGANGDLFNNTGIKDLGGWFDNNNHGYAIYNPNGTVVGAAKTEGHGENARSKAPLFYLDSYYTVELKKDKSFAAEISNGQSKKSIAEIQAKFPDEFVDKDGKEIPVKYFSNDKQWKWTFEEDPEENKEYTVRFENDTDAVAADYEKLTNGQMTVTQFAQAHRDLFAKTTEDNEVLDKEIERSDSWTYEKKSQTVGYYVYVGEENGDFALGQWEAPNKKQDSWNISQNRWKYYEKLSDIPEDITYYEFWEEGKPTYDSSVGNGFNNLKIGYGFPASRLENVTSIQNSDQKIKSNTVYTFKYKYEGYIFRFELIGVKFNDILKRTLFYYEDQKDSDGNVIKTADEQYEDTHIKVITLTPSMINQMDRGDSADTLDIVERADMFYVATYDSGTNGINALLESYLNFSDPDRDKTSWVSFNGELPSFHENDLEWVDCMKIVKRLSGDSSLPMAYSRQMGTLLDEGVKRDGAVDIHMYMDDKYPCAMRPGSLNNISKMFLITTQFDLQADKNKPNNEVQYIQTFMDDVYDNIYQVPLTEDTGRDPDSAKYTGFYMRELCKESDHTDQKEKEKCYYLWNILTFLPNVPTEPLEDSLYTSAEHTSINVENFMKYGFLKTSVESNVDAYLKGYIKGDGGTTMGGVTGTVDPENDYQNVIIIHIKGQPANGNFSPFGNEVSDYMNYLTELILSNGTPLTPSMRFSVINNKETRKVYQKISNDSVLIDYSQSATYKTDKNLYVLCNLSNADNEETSIIKSVKLINKDDPSKPEITIKPEDSNGTALEKKSVDFDKSQNKFAAIEGYAVPEKQTLTFRTPFLRSKWQEGYTTIRVEWVSRSSKETTSRYTPYQNPENPDDADEIEKSRQFAEVTIGERGLFNLQ